MSSLGYGMYGFNVLNVNGETSDLPVCRLSKINGAQSVGVTSVTFADVLENGTMMAVPNQGSNAGTYSAIRTPISGLYEIEAQVLFNAGASAGTAELDIYIDKGANFAAATGAFAINGANAYLIALTRSYLSAAGIQQTLTVRRVLFLEKDCYVSVYGSTAAGTAVVMSDDGTSYFSVRCISAENFPKASAQT